MLWQHKLNRGEFRAKEGPDGRDRANHRPSCELYCTRVNCFVDGRRGVESAAQQCPVLGLPHIPIEMERVVVQLRCGARDISVDWECACRSCNGFLG